MTPLYTLEEFTKSKSRNLLPLKCECCGETFYRKKNDIQWILKKNNNGMKYCSTSCFGKHKHIKSVFISKCSFCGKSLTKTNNQIRSKNVFCNSHCFGKFNITHKTTGTRRSKLEKWIEEQLTVLYPSLEIHYNKTNVINAELDIYIPSLKLAFELNGIFHYEPIYGIDKLESTKNNDNRKFQSCLEKNINLCIIDTHNVKYLKKERDKKFLDIITNIINQLINRLDVVGKV
jgi:hypothetical protein